tara:strand:+ start:1355 stop:1471 length:117 start_codon:yes stop_codon:yes gene_type:complete
MVVAVTVATLVNVVVAVVVMGVVATQIAAVQEIKTIPL